MHEWLSKTCDLFTNSSIKRSIHEAVDVNQLLQVYLRISVNHRGISGTSSRKIRKHNEHTNTHMFDIFTNFLIENLQRETGPPTVVASGVAQPIRPFGNLTLIRSISFSFGKVTFFASPIWRQSMSRNATMPRSSACDSNWKR